ncbi:ATP-binding cassette domain-containing protein [bacterium]|nr:ATP-binding cassette domain-containing protein [bacterium]
MISVQDLVKKYGSFVAVDHLSFEVERGELFGLLGPNGAGKTTTISVLSTLLPADGGTVVVAGCDVGRDPGGVRRRIGMVPQEIALYEDLSARDNLRFWGQLYGLSGSSLHTRVDELLEAVELTEHGRQRVSRFSGGMKRRLNLAAGLMHGPEVLFLDEPTVGIDAQARSKILDLIRRLNDDGLTVLYTTHYLEEAEQLCDRIGVIDQGRLAALGDKDELIRQIGDEDTIRFVLPPEAFDDLVAAAAAWGAIGDPEIRRGRVVLRVVDGGRALPQLQAWLEARDLPLAHLEIERPNLENLYLNLTGRALRETT